MNTEVFRRVRLRGVSGKFRDSEYFLDREVFRIGRAPGSELVLAERTVSGRHARIVHQADGYWLEDLESTNGTFVNGQRINRQRLRTGDRVAFDKIEFVFEDPNDVPRTMTAASRDGIKPPEETLPRARVAPVETREYTPRPTPPPAPPPVRRRAVGLLLGLVLAFLAGYAGLLAAAMAAGGGFSSPLRWFRGAAAAYPLMYLPAPWVGMDAGLPLFLGLAGILLAPVLGGFAAWRMGRGSRIAAAMGFSALYTLIALTLSLGASRMRFAVWGRGIPPLMPSVLPAVSDAVLAMVIVWAVCFLLALLGSLFSR